MTTIVLFIIVFGVIVIAHELGHFLLAKANGITVVEFSIGMGPKLLHFDRGGTEYSLRLLPIGGACMFEGENGLEEEGGTLSEGAFPKAKVWARISTVFAGPFFNFLLAYAFAVLVVAYAGSDRPVIQDVIDGYPAQEAGMQSGDVVIRMNGERIYLGREISLYTLVNPGETVTVEYLRDGQKRTAVLTPRYDEAEGRYLLGFQGYAEYVDCRNAGAFKYAYYEVRYGLKMTVKSLGLLLTGKAGVDDMAGPVGMAQIIGEVQQEAVPYGPLVVAVSMVNLAMLLSVNLGVINLLPLPALDGGRLVFLLVEAVRGKPVPPEKEGMVHFAGFVLLMVLMVVVMFNDISRLLG
ncbi:MAG TPA: RIP metalloprotease RseP [Candidatus Eisenbergiella stercorigallinarum]|uniref:Zinc metalloprotease n=1 Tax=Candidatus Eisenbergiella stercorigallinarum TaxID=2838557 RepID=A0A9D2R225_9FIRM|nr:RIP metalloprotease RseP [Candidatus Eisenbergiella stercorigallinarum]